MFNKRKFNSIHTSKYHNIFKNSFQIQFKSFASDKLTLLEKLEFENDEKGNTYLQILK